MVPIYIGNSGTSFTISGVIVQFIIGSEAFSLCTGADSTGNIKFPACHIIPNTSQCVKISRIFSERCYVCHARIQVSGSYSMSHYFVLLQDRLMILAIFIQSMTVGSAPSLFYEVLRHLQVVAVSCHLI